MDGAARHNGLSSTSGTSQVDAFAYRGLRTHFSACLHVHVHGMLYLGGGHGERGHPPANRESPCAPSRLCVLCITLT